MDACEQEAKRAGLERGEVGAAVEAAEWLVDAGQLDVSQRVDRNREAACELEQLDLAGVVKEGCALVVACGV